MKQTTWNARKLGRSLLGTIAVAIFALSLAVVPASWKNWEVATLPIWAQCVVLVHGAPADGSLERASSSGFR